MVKTIEQIIPCTTVPLVPFVTHMNGTCLAPFRGPVRVVEDTANATDQCGLDGGVIQIKPTTKNCISHHATGTIRSNAMKILKPQLVILLFRAHFLVALLISVFVMCKRTLHCVSDLSNLRNVLFHECRHQLQLRLHQSCLFPSMVPVLPESCVRVTSILQKEFFRTLARTALSTVNVKRRYSRAESRPTCGS